MSMDFEISNDTVNDFVRGSDALEFVSRCSQNVFSGLFADLNFTALPHAVYTGPEHLVKMFDSWNTMRESNPVQQLFAEGDAQQTVFWRLPRQSELVFVFDTFLHTGNRFAAVRKLVSRIAPGGFAVVVTTAFPSPKSLAPDAALAGFEFDGERRFVNESVQLGAMDMLVRLLMDDFERSGMKWIKRSVYKNMFYGDRLPVHDSTGLSVANVLNVFDYSSHNGLLVQESPFIPSGKVLEKLALSIMIFQKPVAYKPFSVENPLTESVFGKKGEFAYGDRRADFFVDADIRTELSAPVLDRLKRVLSWSFSKLTQGEDYDCFSGRSAYITLVDENGAPAPITIGDYTIRSIKIKGAVFDSDRDFDTFDAVPDSMLSFNESGIYQHTNFDDKPMGSMTFAQAANEFKVMQRAVEHSVMTDFPIGLCCFPDILFQNRRTGAAIIGVDETEPSDKYRFFMQFNELLGNTDVTDSRYVIKADKAKLPRALKVLVAYGTQLRHFHDSGLLHVLGHNNQVSIRSSGISFHDFEYSLVQDGMTVEQRTAYRIQDLRRALCGVRIYKSADTLGLDFRQALLSGYFHDVADTKLFSALNDDVLNDKLMLFFDPPRARADEFVAWMLRQSERCMATE